MWWKPTGYVLPQVRPQLLHGNQARRPGLSGHKCFGIQIVGIHQAGVEHSGKKHSLGKTCLCISRCGCHRQSYFFLPSRVGCQTTPLPSLHTSPKGRIDRAVCLCSPVRQSTVMSHHRERGKNLSLTAAFISSCRRMIHHVRITAKTLLKCRGIFANIVGHPGQLSLIFSPKGARKFFRQFGGSLQVGKYRLLTVVLGNMCEHGIRWNHTSSPPIISFICFAC